MSGRSEASRKGWVSRKRRAARTAERLAAMSPEDRAAYEAQEADRRALGQFVQHGTPIPARAEQGSAADRVVQPGKLLGEMHAALARIRAREAQRAEAGE